METQRRILTLPRAMICVVLLVSCAMALTQNDKYACTEPDPQSLCNAGNTCGLGFRPLARWMSNATATEPQRHRAYPARKATARSA